MKFLKLNKLNEDFFDDVEIGVDDEIENDEEYEFSIKFKPVCGSREVKFFVNMIPFDNMLTMFKVLWSHFSFCVVSGISFTVECEKYKKTFNSVHNSPTISEIVTQYADVSMNNKEYQSVSKIEPFFTYSVKFSVPFKLKNMRMFKKDMVNLSKWYYFMQNYYTAITVDTSCYKDCMLKKNGEVIYETKNQEGIQYIIDELKNIVVENPEADGMTFREFDDYIYKKVGDVKGGWKRRFYDLKNVSKKNGIADIELKKRTYAFLNRKSCRVFVYDVSEVRDGVNSKDICDFVYDNTVGKFSYYDKICISEHGKIPQEMILIYIICDDENVGNVPLSVKRKDKYTTQYVGEIITTLFVVNSEQAKRNEISKYINACNNA